jgi:hypothetical protein
MTLLSELTDRDSEVDIGPVLDAPATAEPSPAAEPIEAAVSGRPIEVASRPGRKRARGRAVTEQDRTPAEADGLALRQVDGHLLRTKTETWAWYRLPNERWNFRGMNDRTNAILGFADQLAELSGHWLHLRVTWRPVSPKTWAAAHDELAVDRLPDTEQAVSYDDYLVGEQRAIAGRAHMVKEVHVGVLLAERRASDRALDRTPGFLRRAAAPLITSEAEEIAGKLALVDRTMTAAGIAGWRSSPADIDWLLARSVGLGLPAHVQKSPVAEHLDPSDLATYTDPVAMWQQPYVPTVTVHARTGEHAGLSREVAVLRVGLMHGLHIPERDLPWMVTADRTGVPVEWSARFFIRDGEQVRGELQHQADKVRAQVRHYEDEHKLEPPLQLARQAALVARIDDELTTGFTSRGTRVQGWWSLALSAPTADAAVELAQTVTDAYKPKVRIEHPEAQYAHAREFIPGEPIASQAYKRRGSVVWAAAGMPHVTSQVGDQQGVQLGVTAGATPAPVAWDMWLSQQRDRSGLTVFPGGLGSGKTVLMMMLVYKSCRAGARWTVLDPSGPTARLAALPELREHSRVIDLLAGQPGILNPYRVVAEPRLEQFLDEIDPASAWQRAQTLADATRRRLMRDVITGLLPYEVAAQADTRTALLRAVRAAGTGPDHSPMDVLQALHEDQTSTREASENVLGFVQEMFELLAPLIPVPGQDPYADDRDDRLTVLTMPGLVLPRQDTDRRDWETEEQLGIQMLGLAAWLTQATVYSQPMHARKGVMIDEAYFLTEVSTGRSLMNRFVRDSRKWALRVLLGTQIPQDLLSIRGIESLIDSAFLGRLDGGDEQTAALRLAQIPTDLGYERVLGALPKPRPGVSNVAREYLFADGAGGVEKVRALFDAPHLAHVMAALSTTPHAQRRTDDAAGLELPEMI